MYKFKRGLTADQAALLATGLTDYNTVAEAHKNIESNRYLAISLEGFRSDPRGREHPGFGFSDDDYERYQYESSVINEALEIRDALVDEISLACEWHDYLNGLQDHYSRFPETPTQPTVIETFSIWRFPPDSELSFCPMPDRTEASRVSLANWFKQFDEEKASLIDPQKHYRTFITGYPKQEKHDKQSSQKESSNLRTNEKTLLITLAILSEFISEKIPKYSNSGKPNYSQIQHLIEDKLEELDIDATGNGILKSNIKRDLSKAYRELQQIKNTN